MNNLLTEIVVAALGVIALWKWCTPDDARPDPVDEYTKLYLRREG